MEQPISTETPAVQAKGIEYPVVNYKGWTISHELRKSAVKNSTGVYELVEKPVFVKKGHTAEYQIGEKEYLRYLAYSLNNDSWEGI